MELQLEFIVLYEKLDHFTVEKRYLPHTNYHFIPLFFTKCYDTILSLVTLVIKR